MLSLTRPWIDISSTSCWWERDEVVNVDPGRLVCLTNFGYSVASADDCSSCLLAWSGRNERLTHTYQQQGTCDDSTCCRRVQHLDLYSCCRRCVVACSEDWAFSIQLHFLRPMSMSRRRWGVVSHRWANVWVETIQTDPYLVIKNQIGYLRNTSLWGRNTIFALACITIQTKSNVSYCRLYFVILIDIPRWIS